VTLPRLSGPRVALVPLPRALARAVVRGDDPAPALLPLGLQAGAGWPHRDTADALRPLAEHGACDADGGWLIVVEGAVVGECGWRGGPDHYGDVLLDYGLAGSARGRGLGTEAVAVLCSWAERQPGVRRLVAEVLTGNEPSVRLLRRLGFDEESGDPPFTRWTRTRTQRVRGRHVC
jgi:RimJ/RimL family protein N-acetyltransferase